MLIETFMLSMMTRNETKVFCSLWRRVGTCCEYRAPGDLDYRVFAFRREMLPDMLENSF